MSDFKKIETQEELDAIVKNHIAREREKYQDYDGLKNRISELETENSNLQTALSDVKTYSDSYTEQITELKKQVTNYESEKLRTNIALQYGLPIDLASRLQGEDEESVKADAERLSSVINTTSQPQPPIKSTEPITVDGKDASWLQMARDLRKGE